MYGFVLFLLFFGVYLAPAIAFFPTLLNRPLTAAVLPLFSVSIVVVMTSVLSYLGWFSPKVVQSLTACWVIVAVLRFFRHWPYGNASWSSWHLRWFCFYVLLLLPYAVKIGTQAFDTADEIYSWNFWALQTVFGEPISFEHTGAPYPQAFPKLLAFQYQLLNNLELQLPIRACLIVFPFCLLTAMTFSLKSIPKKMAHTLAIGLLSIGCIFGLNWQQYFDYGYADLPMAAFLVASMALWVAYEDKGRMRPYLRWGTIALGLMAALTKQAGLLWAGVFLPVFLIQDAIRSQKISRVFPIILISSVLGAWWLGEGQGVTNNSGVIHASKEGRDVLAQLGVAIDRYWVHQPLIALLYGLAAWGSYRERRWLLLWLFFLIPATLCWFLFGAYHLRLGLHILGVLALMVVHSLPTYPLYSWPYNIKPLAERMAWVLLGIFSLGGCLFSYQSSLVGTEPTVLLAKASTVSFKKYFGADSEWILANLYDQSDKRLFVPASYIYGLFYGHASMVRPQSVPGEIYDEAALLRDWALLKPDYIFTSGRLKQGDPASSLTEKLAEKHPEWLVCVAKSPNRYGYKVYRLEKGVLKRDFLIE